MVGGRFWSSHFSRRQTLRVFPQKLVDAVVDALHDSEQIEVGGVTGGSLAPSCNSFFFPILGNRRKNGSPLI